MRNKRKKHPPVRKARLILKGGRALAEERERCDPLSVSMPRWQWEAVHEMARREGLTRSQVVSASVQHWLGLQGITKERGAE